jgi:hypothetical protein
VYGDDDFAGGSVGTLDADLTLYPEELDMADRAISALASLESPGLGLGRQLGATLVTTPLTGIPQVTNLTPTDRQPRRPGLPAPVSFLQHRMCQRIGMRHPVCPVRRPWQGSTPVAAGPGSLQTRKYLPDVSGVRQDR